MKFNLKTFAVILTLSTLGLGCASVTARTPANLDKTRDLIISLDPGTWCYAVYQGKNTQVTPTIIEIKTSVNEQCHVEPRKTATLGRDISLELINADSQRSNGLDNNLHRLPQVSFEVAPLTTMQLLVGSDGSTNQWPIVEMKNGTVKFFVERSSARSMGGTWNENSRTFLDLPQELENIVNDFAKGNGPVIIIIRYEVQEGKKGLNAVNVKLSSLMNKNFLYLTRFRNSARISGMRPFDQTL